MDINSETRNKWIKIRVSSAEKSAIENKAELVGCKVADLVRQSLQRVNCWTAIDKEIAREKIREIRRIGQNLNQIEVYSIDECFLDFTGMPIDLTAYCLDICRTVKMWTGKGL